MIHIATVHFQSDKWIGIQRAYLQRHLKTPHRIYAWLEGVPAVRENTFYYSCTEPVTSHAIKLNLLADVIYFASNRDDDILIFLDGDAFPVADIEELLREKLKSHKLIAVQRRENAGDTQPHPCFCATTVGFWKEIRGDWKQGYRWRNKIGRLVTDVGGNLMKQLQDKQIEWYPLLRSYDVAAHPILFGIYAGAIYHHGAGFRNPVTRGDLAGAKLSPKEKIRAIFPWRYRRVLRNRIGARNSLLSEQIFHQLKTPALFEETCRSKPPLSLAELESVA